MYYIQKNGEPAMTTDPNEVTRKNFLVEPGGENRIWVKLTKHEFDQRTGEKKMLVNQINSLNPGDFEFCVRNWRQNEITIEMLHDPRPEQKGDGVEDKLAKLKANLADENKNQNENGKETPPAEDWQKTVEAKEVAEKKAAALEAELAEMKAKSDAEARAAFETQEKAKAEEEARLKAEEKAKAKAEPKGEKKSSK